MSLSNLMGQYSIKQLENLSGVKAHTIRIWEQRYNVLVPSRTKTNIRYYDDEQLKKLLNISILYNKGFKISKLAKLPDSEVSSLIKESVSSNLSTAHEERINALLIAMIDYDEIYFEQIFSEAVSSNGFLNTVSDVIYPFLHKVGMMWTINEVNPSQEHFMTHLIRQKFIAAIDDLPIETSAGKTFLLFLPEGEMHEIGLLIAYYILKEKGHKVIYLGQNVPIVDIVAASKQCNCSDIFTILTNTKILGKPVDDYIAELSGSTPKSNFLLSLAGHIVDEVKLPTRIKLLSSIEDFKNIV